MVPPGARLSVGPHTRVPSSPAVDKRWRREFAHRGMPTLAKGTMTRPEEDPELIVDAMIYVEEVHKALAAENTAPPPGVEGRVVAAVLADPALAGYVRDWARQRRVQEASLLPPEPPPLDDAYCRVRDLLVTGTAAR